MHPYWSTVQARAHLEDALPQVQRAEVHAARQRSTVIDAAQKSVERPALTVCSLAEHVEPVVDVPLKAREERACFVEARERGVEVLGHLQRGDKAKDGEGAQAEQQHDEADHVARSCDVRVLLCRNLAPAVGGAAGRPTAGDQEPAAAEPAQAEQGGHAPAGAEEEPEEEPVVVDARVHHAVLVTAEDCGGVAAEDGAKPRDGPRFHVHIPLGQALAHRLDRVHAKQVVPALAPGALHADSQPRAQQHHRGRESRAHARPASPAPHKRGHPARCARLDGRQGRLSESHAREFGLRGHTNLNRSMQRRRRPSRSAAGRRPHREA